MKLSSRLILSVVVIEACMLSLLVWNSVRLINSSHAELLERSIWEESTLLANSLAPGLSYNDRATLRDVLSLLQDKQTIDYVQVTNWEGKVMAVLGKPPAAGTRTIDHGYRDAMADGVFDIERTVNLAGQRLGTLRAGYSIAEVERLTKRTRLENATIALVELALSIAATVTLGLILTRSLRKLEGGARALEHGQLSHRIDLHSKDEIGDLAKAFNQLAEHLEETQAELRQNHLALELEKRRLETLLSGISAVVWEADPVAWQFTYVSQEAENLLGHPVQEWLRPDFFQQYVHGDDLERVRKHFTINGPDYGAFSSDFRMLNSQGKYIWVRDISTAELTGDSITRLRGLMLDVNKQKAAEERIVFLAEHDALTGLINRRRFQEELENNIAYTQRYHSEGALLFIDLDQFKYINDTFGHHSGDEYLIQVAGLLAEGLRDTDILGRLGGDEFGVILPRANREEAEQVALHLLERLASAKLLHNGHCSHVTASIGITLFPTQATSASDLLAKADTAMYAAKEKGRNRHYVFDKQDLGVVRMHSKIHWEERIRRALEEDRFLFHYQPVIELSSGRVRHYEALLRMRGDDGVLILPGSFLDTAEHFGLIREIDRWVLNSAIRAQGESRHTHNPVRIALNLSGRHFGNSEILELVRQALDTYQADPASIIFEVTETAAVENLAEARSFIESLRELGCRFALDDFGIGFSSLHYLKHLPVDFIKIDGSFVRQIHQNRADRTFVKAIADLADGLGIIAIAEFVENERVLMVLRDLGVHLGQGYYLGRPKASFLSASDDDLERAAART